MAAPQAYVHPPDNPLLAPLNQLGTSIDTNYTNSWTLREIIRTNAQYILDQLARIQQSVTDMQDQFVANRNMVVQLQNTIYDLQDPYQGFLNNFISWYLLTNDNKSINNNLNQ